MRQDTTTSRDTTDPFVEYYREQSEAPETHAHFLRLRRMLLNVFGVANTNAPLRVADIGCGAGSFSRIWADAGCEVGAVDINPELIDVARTRSATDGRHIDFRVGSAVALPWPTSSFDIVVLP